jgi:hypothetical protein
LHVRVDFDEFDIPRFRLDAPARAILLQGHPGEKLPLTFVRVEPYVVPKRSLTGGRTERADTRLLQVIYSIDTRERRFTSASNWACSSMCVCRQIPHAQHPARASTLPAEPAPRGAPAWRTLNHVAMASGLHRSLGCTGTQAQTLHPAAGRIRPPLLPNERADYRCHS